MWYSTNLVSITIAGSVLLWAMGDIPTNAQEHNVLSSNPAMTTAKPTAEDALPQPNVNGSLLTEPLSVTAVYTTENPKGQPTEKKSASRISTSSQDLGPAIGIEDIVMPVPESPEFKLDISASQLLTDAILAEYSSDNTSDAPSQPASSEETQPPTQKDPSAKPSEELLPNPFGLEIPKKRDKFDYSQKKHCDVIRHLKVPATSRRLDAYVRPEYILRRPQSRRFLDQDQLFAIPGRQALYEQGVDVYGCSSTDYLVDLHSNLSKNPLVRGPSGPWHYWQLTFNQVVGLDLYSRLVSKTWQGGQLHFSGVYAEVGNLGPIYSYGNTLNPAGLGTRQYHGYFYTDVGRSRDVNSRMQGIRLFEYWFQQAYGHKNQSYIRVGAINPWITFNKSILSGLFGFWTFDEPGVIGTTPATANGPLVNTAPPGISLEHVWGDNIILKGMVASGYWDPTGGVENRRGTRQYWDLDKYGLEFFYEATYRGGTYSLNPNDNGKPWFIRLGGQHHTGYGESNFYDVNGNPFFLTNQPRQIYYGNSQYYAMLEGMIYREPGSYDRGLTGFLKVKWSPWEFRGSSTKAITFGLAYEGLFGRKDDVLFLGYSHMLFNRGVIQRSKVQRECTLVPGCDVSGFQSVFELGYSAQLTKFLWLNPKLFYVHNPNIRRDLGDIFSFGIELRISL